MLDKLGVPTPPPPYGEVGIFGGLVLSVYLGTGTYPMGVPGGH